MSFRSQTKPPIAYHLRPGLEPDSCIIQSKAPCELTLELLNPCSIQVGETLHLSIDPRNSDLERCVPSQVLQVLQRGTVLRVAVSDSEAFWASAQAAEAFNRRQAFRVSTLDLLPHRDKRDEDVLQTVLQQAGNRFDVEMLDLSLTGCGIRIRNRNTQPPAMGTTVFIEVQGGDLPKALRLPARVERFEERGRYTQLGLAFLMGENRMWQRVEAQISSYLMKRQQFKAHRKAA